MPSSPGYVRDYQRERETAIKRGETGTGHMASDSIRHRARRKVEKRLGRKLSPNETVEHKTPIKSGGGNGNGNLTVKSFSSNSKAGGKMGNRKGKATGNKKNNGRSARARRGALSS